MAVERSLVASLVADGTREPLPAPKPRSQRLPAVRGKVDVVVGMRRSGKTWFLFQEMRRRLEEGMAREDLLYVTFEDERLRDLDATELHWFEDEFYAQEPSRLDRPCWLFLDEIQNVEGWERFVRRLLDSRRLKLVVSGSSAKLLSREVATSLRGRGLETEILPFSFAEFCTYHDVSIPKQWPSTTRQAAGLRKALERYFAIGGFPEVQDLDAELRTRIHQSYVDVVILRDVVERYGVTNVDALRLLTSQLMRNPSAEFSATKLHHYLRSAGAQISGDTLREYIRHLQDAFLCFETEIFSESLRQRHSNPRKSYVVDPALALSAVARFPSDVGHQLENYVFLELRRRGYRLAYGRTEEGFAVDFVAARDRKLLPIQVSTSLADPAVRMRETRALNAFMKEHRLKRGLIVTMNDEADAELSSQGIAVVPVWKWFLDDSDDRALDSAQSTR